MGGKFIRATTIAICTFLASAPPTLARNISFNQGGHIGNFHKQYDQALFRNEQYRIKGSCMSACTIFLGLPRVCVYPNAQFGFHGAWPKAASAERQRAADAKMGNYLPPRIKELYMKKWRHNGALSFTVLTGKQIVALQPGLKLCADA